MADICVLGDAGCQQCAPLPPPHKVGGSPEAENGCPEIHLAKELCAGPGTLCPAEARGSQPISRDCFCSDGQVHGQYA